MRLRSLEIQGFKSFPDKTKLEFGDGITAVVGPNGSGKSNIADAVRWVLGEQSTKTLRGGKMEDVIFGGTQTRKAVGYASVQLVIDNTDRTLAGQDSEIIIMRRLYRSGESEYRINGAMVRLKDIHEMLMDTGLGRDGYSIIGQGRISEIVSAKSRERREIFEEAAGIAKYRYRKIESEKRLAQAEENLVRLRDILDELESRVGPLRIQAEKARNFLKLAGEKKELEISLWMLSLDDLRGQLSQQENRIDICKNEYEQLERESERIEEKINTAYEQSHGLDIQVDNRRLQIKLLEEKLGKFGADAAVLGNDIHHNKLSIQRVEADLATSGSGTDGLEAALSEKIALFKQSEIEICAMQSRIVAAEERLSEQGKQAARVSDEISQLYVRRNSVEKAVNDTKLKQAATASVLAVSQTRLDTIRQNGVQHEAYISDLREARDECSDLSLEQERKIEGLSNSQKGYMLKRESRMKKLDDIRARIQEYESAATQKIERAKLLDDLEKNMEGFTGSVKYILSQADKNAVSGISGVVSSLVSADERYTMAIETALGPALQNIVVEDEETAKKCIRMLQNARAGRATFLPLTTVKGQEMNAGEFENHDGFIGVASSLVSCEPRYKGVIAQLLGRIIVVEDLDCGTKIAKGTGYRTRVVTLDGQVINAGGSFTGGSNVKSAGVLGRRNEIEKLREEAADLRKKAAAVSPELKAATEELSALEAAISGVASELQTAQEERVRLTAQLENLEKNLIQAKENKSLAEKELDALTDRLKALEIGGASDTALLDEMSAQVTEFNEKLRSAEDRRATLTIGAETCSAQIAEQKMTLLAAQKDLENASAEIGRIREQIENADTRSKQLEQEKAELEARNAAILLEIQSLEQENESIRAEITENNNDIAALIGQRTVMEGETTVLRQSERELSSNRENVSKELVRLEERRHGVQSEYNSIITKLWDEYELTRSQANDLAIMLPDKDKAARRLSELRGKIKAIGTVNVDAIEEYAEVSVRYDFLSAQVRDVEDSKTRLQKMIIELTQEMREIFAGNFAKIASHFSKVFVQLFGGGKAELTLTEEEDVLESGVDIFVQPPGKVIKNLSLLSGGEQAFVAIAIYFAILKVKPAPFCLLDEIEAALDDVNVTRFANYLRQMSAKTQFIAITHRRGTMEEADVLYGVTMQEEGVSKLLELKVSEIESKLGRI